MPFKSLRQIRHLLMNNPKLAKKWFREYGMPDGLPYKVDKKKGK
jgi:hypothetical protein